MRTFETWWGNVHKRLDIHNPVEKTYAKEGYKVALSQIVRQMDLNPYMDNSELRSWIERELGED